MKTLLAIAASLFLMGCSYNNPLAGLVESPVSAATLHVAIADAQAAVQRESIPDLPPLESENDSEPAAQLPPLDIEAFAESISEAMQAVPDAPAGEELSLAPDVPEIAPESDVEDALQSYEPTPSPRLHTDDGYLTPAGVVLWLEQNGHRDHWSYPSGNDTVNEHISHMVGEHGWERWQLDGLTYQQLERLHSADHDGLVGPRSRVEEEVAMAAPSDGGCIPVSHNPADGYYYWAHGGRQFRWHTLEDGTTYGGNFLYSDGCMHFVGIETPTATAPVRLQQSTTRSSNCPGGNCGRPMYFPRWRLRR